MQITIFSVWMTFVWCSIFIVLCYILRKRSVLLNLSSMTGIIILYLFCLIRLAVPVELPWTKVVLNYTNQIKGMDISMYSDAKIVKKKIKVNRINTVQISAQVEGSDVVKFLDQMGMSKEINAAAAVDYNTLPAIKVTCWIDKKTCRPVRTTADMKAFMNGYMSALYQKLGQDLKLVYSQAKVTVTYKNFNKAATFTIPKECR